MKKITSLALILIIMLTMLSVVFADVEDEGEYITEERITQEAVPAVEEIAEWKATELNRTYSGDNYPVNDENWVITVEINGLNYDIKAKYKNLTEKTISGTFDQVEGQQELILICYRKDFLTFTFDITNEITQEAVEAVPEIKTLFYVGYEYENGCKVMFNKELELTDKELLDTKKPFIPGKNKIWSGRLFWKIYLYKACDWECPAPSTSPPETETSTPPTTTETITTPPATTEAIITTEPIQTTSVNTPAVTETNTIVKNNTEKLPKTGENSPINYMIVGAIVLVAGLFLFLRLRIN